MKKVLVITLVLVMAFASSAMASVSFSGKFTATAEMNSFRVFTENYTLTPGISFTIGASNKSETDEVVNWDFTGGINLVESKFKLGKYKLGLYDNYFDIWVWGNKQELTAKSTHFSMVSAGKTAAADTMRARLAVPVMDLGTVTVDLTAPSSMRAFVDVKALEGFNVSLGYLRDWTDKEDAKNVIAAGADTTIATGDIDVTLEAGAGVTLAEELGFALALGAESDITDELNVNASVEHANANWAGDAVTPYATVLAAGATYSEDVFQVSASGSFTIEGAEEEDNSNTLTLGAKYRMSDALAYKNLFHKDHWFKNTAPAFGAGVELKNFKFDNVYADVTSPVVEDMVWVKGAASYNSEKDVSASVLGHIVPFDKLTVIPLVKYEYNTDTKVGTPTVNLKANYKIGASTTELKFEAQREFIKDAPTSLLKLSVEVPF